MRVASLLLFILVSTALSPRLALAEEPAGSPAEQQASASSPNEYRLFKIVFEPDAYYTDVDLIIALTKAPIPSLGEMSEQEIYGTLLTRAAVLPQFLVLEASVNPLPWFGTYLKKNERDFYDRAQVSGSFNWVKAVTTGFEEPYAFSVLAGNVANFYLPGSADTKGLGYSGYLFSTGNYYIKDNELVPDTWREFEWKMKGDRKSPVKKLSWSFRIGAKLHSNPNITETIYLTVRRSKIDYKPEGSSLFNNSGFEYTYDMDRRTFSAIRHYFFVDKKWPLTDRRMALSLALGFVWESARKYTGELATGRGNDLQVLLRPNIEF